MVGSTRFTLKLSCWLSVWVTMAGRLSRRSQSPLLRFLGSWDWQTLETDGLLSLGFIGNSDCGETDD